MAKDNYQVMEGGDQEKTTKKTEAEMHARNVYNETPLTNITALIHDKTRIKSGRVMINKINKNANRGGNATVERI